MSEKTFDWDDVIEDDGEEKGKYILLPEGDYQFRVTKIDKTRHNGSAKIPPCNKAVVYMEIDAPEGTATVQSQLFLYEGQEWKLTSFFRSIGQKERGKRLKMDWNKALFASGRCHIGNRTYNGREYNEVRYFLEWDPEAMTVPKEKQASFAELDDDDSDIPF